MSIQKTDRLLINRSGASYYTTFEDLLELGNNDLVLVNRNGSSYKLTGSRVKALDFNDSDLFLVNRGGSSFKCGGSEIKTGFGPPAIQSVRIEYNSKNNNGSIFRFHISEPSRPFDQTITPTVKMLLIVEQGGSAGPTSHTFTNSGSIYEFSEFGSTGLNQYLTPAFTFPFAENALTFDMYIPNSVKFNNTGYTAVNLLGSSRWTASVAVIQNNIESNTVTSNPFECKIEYFNG